MKGWSLPPFIKGDKVHHYTTDNKASRSSSLGDGALDQEAAEVSAWPGLLTPPGQRLPLRFASLLGVSDPS